MPNELDPIDVNKVALKSLKQGSMIAEGGFAGIYSATSSKDGHVALRILKKQHRFNSEMKKRFRNGIEVRRNCGHHPNIINYIAEGGGMFELPFEVSEFVNGKNLKSHIFGRDPKITSKPIDTLRQCAAAMMHIHQIGYLHLDIKPENYLVDMSSVKPSVKLTDFDLCLPIKSRNAPPGFGGSPMYLAPEYFESKEVSVATDVFAFGVMAFNICTGEMPFVGSVQSLMRSNYKIHFPASFHNNLTPRMKDFILKCLARMPKGRFRDGGELFFALEQINMEQTKEFQRAQLGITE